VERTIAATTRQLVAGCDEVGRGALGGPVSVGATLVDLAVVGAPPPGLADSKVLSPRRREAVVPLVEQWVTSWAVGHASAQEIDHLGLTAALRLAGQRALAQLSHPPEVVLLDGRHDWLTEPTQRSWLDDGDHRPTTPPVITRVKADRDCASVAAASVVAKVTRDRLMTDLARSFPVYRWDVNKGYGSPEHLEALARHGPCIHHRRSWRLPARTTTDPTSVTSARTSGPGQARTGRLVT
jgi:ribonuclease HII